MDKNKKKNQVKKENQALEDKAINQNASQAEKINHQVKQRKEKHQPRDKA